MPSPRLVLTAEQRTELESRVRSRRGRADAARRARVILLIADGHSYHAITTMTGCSSRTIALWKRRFEEKGLSGLAARHHGSKPSVLTPTLEAKILAWTKRSPPHGATHWSTRSLGRHLAVQHTIVARAWQRAGLNRIGSSGTCARTIPTLRRKRLTSSGCMSSRRSMPRCLASMRKPRFRRWIGWNRSCRWHPDARSAMGLSRSGMARCRSMRR